MKLSPKHMYMRNVQRVGNNPWVTKALEDEKAFGNGGIYFQEFEDADRTPPITCPQGHDAYFKPSVGTYVCPVCRQIKCGDEWVGCVR